jgi:hypothetical protein
MHAHFKDQHFSLLKATSSKDVEANWLILMHIAREASSETARKVSPTDLTYFTRDGSGRWTISGPIEVGKAGVSHISIHIPRLLYRTWNGELPPMEESPTYTDHSIDDIVIYDQCKEERE